VKERHTTEYYAADRSNRGCIAPWLILKYDDTEQK
jgi:hypothetical protein